MDAAANLAIILIGQPTLRHNLKLGVLAALDQRVALRYHLAGMTTTDTADYINHHTKIAGRADPLYADDALHALHDASRGLPRETSKLALQALVAAYAERKTLVDHASARAAITEVTTESKTP
jgi:type II secretory pathway predicted ATPase ExeA